jgi:hypothetical protein
MKNNPIKTNRENGSSFQELIEVLMAEPRYMNPLDAAVGDGLVVDPKAIPAELPRKRGQ